MARRVLWELIPPNWLSRWHLGADGGSNVERILEALSIASKSEELHGQFSVTSFINPESLLLSVRFLSPRQDEIWDFHLRFEVDGTMRYSPPQKDTGCGLTPIELNSKTPLGRASLTVAACFDSLRGILVASRAPAVCA